ncbi:MAG: 30S ribosomal protein S17 [Bacteroidetes bacterium]|nr:30S ribosomal protein S17 [Bacteroidota bacterium]
MERNSRKEITGVVTSDKRDKTITIFVERKVTHELYGKVMKTSNKFSVHDEKNEAKVGDTVKVAETRPLSKTKRFRLVEVLQKAK